jgi:hypothetical protein
LRWCHAAPRAVDHGTGSSDGMTRNPPRPDGPTGEYLGTRGPVPVSDTGCSDMTGLFSGTTR